ncbi:MAG: DNA polymerase [bacterium]
MKEKKLDTIYEEIEKPIIPIIKEMEDYGILIDKKYLENLSILYHKELDKLTEKIYTMTDSEFNINSPKQLGEVLFEKMGIKSSKKRGASGSFSTKISILEELEDENPVIASEHSERGNLEL